MSSMREDTWGGGVPVASPRARLAPSLASPLLALPEPLADAALVRCWHMAPASVVTGSLKLVQAGHSCRPSNAVACGRPGPRRTGSRAPRGPGLGDGAGICLGDGRRSLTAATTLRRCC